MASLLSAAQTGSEEEVSSVERRDTLDFSFDTSYECTESYSLISDVFLSLDYEVLFSSPQLL